MRYVTVTGTQLSAAIALTFGQPVGNKPADASANVDPEKVKTLGAVEGFLS